MDRPQPFTMYLAVDQDGAQVWLTSQAPRKELLRRLNRRHAERYILNGLHVGYIIAGHRFQLYTVTPWIGKGE